MYIRGITGRPVVYTIPEITRNHIPPGATYTMISAWLHISVVTYELHHTFPSYGEYLVSYLEINRNSGILNMSKSVDTPFYVETGFVLDPALGPYKSPTILAPPIFTLPEGDISISLGAMDSMDNTLYYQLRTPQAGLRRDVANYFLPETMEINEYNGQLTWDGMINGHLAYGELAVAVHIYQYHQGKRIGYMTRDFQIIVSEDTQSPMLGLKEKLDENNALHLAADEEASLKIIAQYDAFNGPEEIALTAFSELADQPSNFTFVTYDSVPGIKVGVLTLRGSESLERDNPYNVVIRSTGIVSFEPFEQKDISLLIYTTETALPPPPVTIDENVDNQIEGAAEGLSAHPNPTVDYIFIEPIGVASGAKLYSSWGQELDAPLTGDVMDLRGLASGIYYLRVYTPSQQLNQASYDKTIRIVKMK
jgi:hypothetical protein